MFEIKIGKIRGIMYEDDIVEITQTGSTSLPSAAISDIQYLNEVQIYLYVLFCEITFIFHFSH